MRPSPWMLLLLLMLASCDRTGAELDGGASMAVQVDGEDVPPGWRAPTGACDLDPVDPRGLLLTTTDFATGAVTVVDLTDGSVTPDVAQGSTDAIPFARGEHVVLVHRHQIDRIDVLERDGWSLTAQHALPGQTVSTNPQAIAFDDGGLAYVAAFAEPWVRVLDLEDRGADAERGRIDLSGFADDDGNPEASLAVRCGDLLLVTAQRLDPGFVPVGTDVLIAIDPVGGEALDLDPSSDAMDGLPLLGGWVRQLRRDPADPTGRTLLGLSTGIERIELATGVRRWAVDPERFAEAGIEGRLQPQAFDVDDTGTMAYLAAYDADFSQVRLYRVDLHGNAPAVPEPFADGFDSVERTLELIGQTLWYGSTRTGAAGLWMLDVAAEPPRVTAGPLPTGLAPYSMVVLP